MNKEQALDQTFAFTLDMVANTQGQLPAHIAMDEALKYFGWNLVESKPVTMDFYAIKVHACRTDRKCHECGMEATR